MKQSSQIPHAVHTDLAPRPRGHYSQAIVHGGLVYCSGQLPLDPRTGELAGEIFGVQVQTVLNNLAAVLAASGSNLQCTLRTTVFLADIRQWDEFDAIYARTFGTHRPARTVVPAGPLHGGALIEMDAVAAVL
jgi:2-iminobutanoate/2-iminopropanoate deaminase